MVVLTWKMCNWKVIVFLCVAFLKEVQNASEVLEFGGVSAHINWNDFSGFSFWLECLSGVGCDDAHREK